MNKLLARRSLLRDNFMLLIGICLCAYFAYHTMQGGRSMIRMLSLDSRIETLAQEYSQVKSEREALEKKVVAMRPGSISRDMLEEKSKTILGYRHPDEMTLMSN